LDVDEKGFLFKGFFFSPSSITKEPDSMSLSTVLAVGSSVVSVPLDKTSMLFYVIHISILKKA
jgi:hypothetical protein